MAIVENRATEIGDVIYIKADVPIIGLLSLLDFADDTTGENAVKSFTKMFRHSVDGINFSEWIDLTTINVSDIEVTVNDTFYIEYRYERIGSSSSGELSFNSIDLTGGFSEPSCGPNYDNSIFNEFFLCTDLEVLSWCVNVAEKLYKKGIVPEYIIRGESGDISDDRDYVDFWRSVACFFAIIVVYARQFERFGTNRRLLLKYLEAWGVFFCNETTTEDLIYIKENYYDEIRQRGTPQIFRKKDEVKQVDGELLRTICFREGDEFIFHANKSAGVGWFIDMASPLYRGANRLSFNKSYEDSEGIIDISKYPLVNDSFVSQVTDGGLGLDVIQINNVPIGETAGIGPTVPPDFTKAIVVEPGLNYEISFQVKQSDITKCHLTFGVSAYDINNNFIGIFNIDSLSISGDSDFFTTKPLNINNQYYLIRGILYKGSELPNSKISDRLGIGFGQHLRFNTTVAKIIPRIVVENTVSGVISGAVSIFNIKIRPASTSYGKGFVQVPNFIDIWLKNNNANLTPEKLEEIMRRYLLPYNSTFKINFL